ncbi:MAG: SUMF1/EgtB/PvdO family nonheme iron enzyme [Rhodospirillales bacterium]|nr:SUMF1/EgtB/PvdO family nonheme iron enzyme [Rhodospirillales bacterium]
MRRELIRPSGYASSSLTRVFACALAVALALQGGAADAAAWPDEHVNPKPAEGDVILPMPCGGAMAFRPVAIPSEGPLSDRTIYLGATDSGRGALEGSHAAQIAGSFADASGQRTYLLGKYEVSRLQYQALAQPCPKPADDLRLPQAEIGWADAVAFADRYSLWLRQNAIAALPKDDGEPGFVRLPTEAEWEFAARGGIRMSESEFTDRVFPMPDGIGSYVWFAGPESANGKAQRIGLLKPNPLGLHDVLGNVDEIMLEPFRLNRLDRLHGQAGGFVVRGGNYATAKNDIRTAYRQEIPFYQGKETRRATTTGFRLAVVGRVITSRARLQAIDAAWAALGTAPEAAAPSKPATPEPAASAKPEPAKPSPLDGPPRADPLDEIETIAQAVDDTAAKQRLKLLQVAVRAGFQARDDQRDRAAKARLRLGTFLCQKLKDDALPIDKLRDVHRACVQDRGEQHERCRGQAAMIEAEEAKLWENLRYYADTLVTLVEDYDDAVLGRQLGILKSELGARGLQGLLPVTDLYYRHALAFRRTKSIERQAWLAQCKAG